MGTQSNLNFTSISDVLYLGSPRKFLANSLGVAVEGSTDWVNLMAHPFSKGILFGLSGATDTTPHSSVIPNMVIGSNGRVGIGITAPEDKLHVLGGFRIGVQSNGYGFSFTQNGAGDLDIQYKTGQTVLSNVMTLGYLGKVGIGTATPTQLLDVAGNIAISNRIYDRNSGEYFELGQYPTGGVQLSPHADNNGSLGSDIRMWDDAWVTEFYYQTQTQVSDSRAKQNIKPITGALASIMKIRGVSYDLNPQTHPFCKNMKPGELEDSKGELGFIGQELQGVFPHMVKYNEELNLNTIAIKISCFLFWWRQLKSSRTRLKN